MESQSELNDANTLNDRAEAFLDAFITRTNKCQDTVVLLRHADDIWAALKDRREKAGRAQPKL